ncbi:14446_t:CDS:2 [Dentiscutata erythropus]|uniref:ATP phosphoribosyltransferase n=1 Tax=Dentiscutata erythropus TaxID=1348616 RepID=A0A9N9HJK5_9GLOM|nr:14446_t:CDS:2 [Dentiscutata erythropus]
MYHLSKRYRYVITPFSSISLSDRLLFGIPKKGRLHEHCLSLLNGADINFYRHNRLDIAPVSNLPIALVFLPAADIPKYVADGNVDLGITGQDMILESQAEERVEQLLDLGFGKCKLQVQVPIKSNIKKVEDLVGKRVVSSFVVLASAYFEELDKKYLSDDQKKEGKKTKIEYVSGSVEAACALGLADGIVDLVESGETMRAAGLHAISTVCNTEAILIRNKHSSNDSLIAKITSRIKGVIAAQKYVLLNYNIQRHSLSKATKITPGRQAPTVSPLDNGDWVEVQSMVCKDEVAEIMDKLEEIGAKDILVFKIDNCRV